MWAWIIAVVEPVIAWLANRWPAFAKQVNGVLIDGIVKQTRSRPHPWSTRTDYISWAGLTDRTFSGRHLAVADFGPLPDPQVTTAELFARPVGHDQRLCPKSTMLFPAFAQYLTDGFIRTQVSNIDALTDRRRNTSNHEIDLCPLYGRNEAQTRVLRLCSSTERGRLKSQIIHSEEYSPFAYDAAGQRLAEFAALDEVLGIDNIPLPVRSGLFAVGGDRANATLGVSMINTLLLREHNRVAGLIAADNPNWDDDRVFEVARNVMIVLFIKLVVEEYINHISPSRICLLADPSGAWRKPWNKPNWITAEFSLLYRWHSLVADEVTWNETRTPTAALQFAGPLLVNTGLGQAFVQMSANPAAQLGIGNTAKFLEPVEWKAIRQAQTNRIAPYNAYRRTMGMPPAKSFKDITADADVARKLEALYPGGVDTVEFYVGMFAEETVANSPLPSLILRMVAVDAFSQALTNPLLSEHIWGDEAVRTAAFTKPGLEAITGTRTLRDLLVRNGGDPGAAFVGMTRPDWVRKGRIQRAA